MRNINALGLFSGGGGLDLGFSAAGFSTVFSSDIDPYSCKTLTQNQGKKSYLTNHSVICEDIKNLSYKTIKKQIGNKDIDFIIGGPHAKPFQFLEKERG